MRISDWSSDVCSSDLTGGDCAGTQRRGRLATGLGVDEEAEARDEVDGATQGNAAGAGRRALGADRRAVVADRIGYGAERRCLLTRRVRTHARCGRRETVRVRTGTDRRAAHARRSEEHTSELQSLMRISYAAFCLKKKN